MKKAFNLSAYDNQTLYAVSDNAESPQAVIVVVHGLCEHLGRYDYLTDKFVQAGFSVYRFDHRGHGLSEGERIHLSDKFELGKDVNSVVDYAKNENPDLPIFIVGHSMGGLAVALFATMYPEKVSGIVLSGAFVRDTFKMTGVVKGDDLDYLENNLGNMISRNQKLVEAYADDRLVEQKISVGLFRRVNEAQQWQKINSAKFIDSVCIMHGGADAIVSPVDSIDFYNQIATKDKSLHIFSGLYHELFNEPERDEIITLAVKWIKERLNKF